MAAITAVLLLLLLLAVVILDAADDGTTHLQFFMHDVVSGSNPTSVQVIQGPGGGGAGAGAAAGMSFGDTSVMDNALTETSSSTSSPVGRMQGVYVLSSLTGAVRMVTANILLTSGDSNGSTIAVMGRQDDVAADATELSVIGGTGKFRMVNGYVIWKNAATNGPDSTVELHVYLGNGNTTIDASAPVSPVDGGGSAGSGSKSSSGGSRSTTMAGNWVVAVAAAMVKETDPTRRISRREQVGLSTVGVVGLSTGRDGLHLGHRELPHLLRRCTARKKLPGCIDGFSGPGPWTKRTDVWPGPPTMSCMYSRRRGAGGGAYRRLQPFYRRCTVMLVAQRKRRRICICC